MEAHRYVESRVWGSELFPLREIRVVNNERVPTQQILDALPLAIGQTMGAVNRDDVEAQLRNAIGDVDTVSITTDLPSGTVVLDVVERQPFARVTDGERTFVVGESGHVLHAATASDEHSATEPGGDRPTAKPESLPTVVSSVTDPGAPNTPASGEGLELALRIISLYETLSLARQGSDAALTAPERLRLESVDAREPDKIAVRFSARGGRKLSAWLSKKRLERGLENLYTVYASRMRAGSMALPEPADLGRDPRGSAGRAKHEAIRESLRVSTLALPSYGSQGIPSSEQASSAAPATGSNRNAPYRGAASATPPPPTGGAVEELYDARFQSTIYVSSVSGGPRG